MFHTIYMHHFGWLSDRGANFLNLLQKEGVCRNEGGAGRGGAFKPWRKLTLDGLVG